MGDRHKWKGGGGVTTAAAKILQPIRTDAPRPEPWHDEAWGFRNTTGELRFAELWLANSLSRVRLVAAKRPIAGGDPEPVEDGPAAELVAELAGGVGGQAALLRAFATHLLTPGIAYLVGEPGPQTANRWGVFSSDQIRLSRSRTDSGLPTYEVIEGDTWQDVRVLPEGALPVKVYRPHPRYSWQPDSPVRGALPILRELSLLTQHVEATATSRLAGAGMLLIDSSVQLPEGWEKWLDELVEAITRPIKDRGLAAAYAPFPTRIPVPAGKKIQDLIHHLGFSTPFDEHAMKLRDEAIGRLATAMDMPKRALTGEQENHWGKWATTEEGITLHVEPNAELICDGLTKGYLEPSLLVSDRRAARDVVTSQDEMRVRILRAAEQQAGPDSEFIVWYDTTNLAVRPDRGQDTKDAYDRFEADGDDLRRELGITDATAWNIDDEDVQQRIWLRLVDHATLGEVALKKLGLIDDDDLPAPAPVVVAPPAPAEPEAPDEPDTPDEDDEAPARIGPPATREAPAPEDQAASAAGLAVVAACDSIVYRALEKAGNRLRQANRRQLNGATDKPAVLMHTGLNAFRSRPADQLLEGAWDRVPEVAARLGRDAAELTAELDAYTQQLIRSRKAHSWDRLAYALGCGPEPAEDRLQQVATA